MWRGPRVIHFHFCWFMWHDHQVYILSLIKFDSISHTKTRFVASFGTFCMPTPRISSWKTTNKKMWMLRKQIRQIEEIDRFFSRNQDINSTKNRGGPLKWVVFFLEHVYLFAYLFFEALEWRFEVNISSESLELQKPMTSWKKKNRCLFFSAVFGKVSITFFGQNRWHRRQR